MNKHPYWESSKERQRQEAKERQEIEASNFILYCQKQRGDTGRILQAIA